MRRKTLVVYVYLAWKNLIVNAYFRPAITPELFTIFLQGLDEDSASSRTYYQIH